MDTRLRALQRAWQVDRTSRAACRYLQELRRAGLKGPVVLRARRAAGELSECRANLAVYLGSAEARLAFAYGGNDPGYCRSSGHLLTWLRGLRPFGQRTLVRAGLAAARALLELHRVAGVCRDKGTAGGLRDVLTVIDAWLDESSEENRYRVARRAQTVRSLGWCTCDDAVLRAICSYLSRFLHAVSAPAYVRTATGIVLLLQEIDCLSFWVSGNAAKRASLGRGRLRNAIRRELTPWALGGSDCLGGACSCLGTVEKLLRPSPGLAAPGCVRRTSQCPHCWTLLLPCQERRCLGEDLE